MKVLTVVGARPQFIKAAPVSRAIRIFNERARKGRQIREIVVHTGQHYDDGMSAVFFRDLGLAAPERDLNIGSGSHGDQTGRMLAALERVICAERPDVTLLYGDTNSTLSGGLAASKLQIPIAHVEAGLRSFNRAMPEEVNRVLVDHVSSLLFCPISQAVRNLEREGITRGVHLVGDVMADALSTYLPVARAQSRILDTLALEPKRYVLATIHRAENTSIRDRLAEILRGLARSARPVVFPCHPGTRARILDFDLMPMFERSAIRVIEPASYLDMLTLTSEAACVVTDSGGLQKEAHWLGVPSVTVRTETEWVDTVEAGGNVVIGGDADAIQAAVMAALDDRRRPVLAPGQEETASERIVNLLADCQL